MVDGQGADASPPGAKEGRTGHIVFRALGMDFLPASVRPISPHQSGGAACPDLLRLRRASSPHAHSKPAPWQAGNRSPNIQGPGSSAGTAASAVPLAPNGSQAAEQAGQASDLPHALAETLGTAQSAGAFQPASATTYAVGSDQQGPHVSDGQQGRLEAQRPAELTVDPVLNEASDPHRTEAGQPRVLKSALSRVGPGIRRDISRARFGTGDSPKARAASTAASPKGATGRTHHAGSGSPSGAAPADRHGRSASRHQPPNMQPQHRAGAQASPASPSSPDSSPGSSHSNSPRARSPASHPASPGPRQSRSTGSHHAHAPGSHPHSPATHTPSHRQPLYAKTFLSQAALNIAQPKQAKVRKAAPPPAKAVVRELLEAAQVIT